MRHGTVIEEQIWTATRQAEIVVAIRLCRLSELVESQVLLIVNVLYYLKEELNDPLS